MLPGKCVRVLKIEGKCSCLRAKAAHISGHLPAIVPYTLLANRNPGFMEKFFLRVDVKRGVSVPGHEALALL